MSKSVLDLLNDELVKTRQDIQDAEKRESDILKAIKAIEVDDLSGQSIEAGDTVEVVSTDLTNKRHGFMDGQMYGIGERFTVKTVYHNYIFGGKFVHDENDLAYALEDLKLIKKKS